MTETGMTLSFGISLLLESWGFETTLRYKLTVGNLWRCVSEDEYESSVLAETFVGSPLSCNRGSGGFAAYGPNIVS